MEKLSNFIDLNKNDLISKMSKKDLIYFLILLNKFYLEYRELLGLSKKHTFGIEIEAEYMGGAFYEEIKPFYEKGWIEKPDASLKNGTEFNSPILIDSTDMWQDLKTICNILNKHYEIKDTCGGHIHIGSQILGLKEQSYRNFIKLWDTYENIIFRFSYGEFLTPRSKIFNCAKPVSNYLFKVEEKEKDFYSKHFMEFINACNLTSLYAVNFNNIKNKQRGKDNTIEIRCPNGTLNPVIWQNNINFFMKLMLFCKSNQFDETILTERRRINGDNYKFEDYGIINLKQAIELADLIFNNNLDKVYFLRQYLKSFEKSNKLGKLIKSKQFTK